VTGTWGAGYGVADVPVTGDVLPATESQFTFKILINLSMYYMFLQINGDVLYILVKLPLFSREACPLDLSLSGAGVRGQRALEQTILHPTCSGLDLDTLYILVKLPLFSREACPLDLSLWALV
jgi:hypothetical protein